jgi:purine-binding chemotaxis protein CheW
VRGIKLIETDVALKFEDLKRSFDLTFQEALIERSQELVHLLIVRVGTTRFALKVADLAGLVRAQTVVPIPAAGSGLLGLAGLKGRMVAAYSLAALIGCPELSTEQARWMVLCRCEREIALAFSGVTGTMMVPAAELSPVSPGAPPHATDAVGSGSSQLRLLNVSSIAETIVQQSAAVSASQGRP